jgi:16S rRNA (cytosine1402-N4)-methyltransferase
VHVIGPRGRVLVLAYQSLEDRMVKTTFARWAADDSERDVPAKLPVRPSKSHGPVLMLTRKPLRPSADEVAANPRAESARLRAVERLPAIPNFTDPGYPNDVA